MKELCRNAGVALIFEPPISKTCLFGSARWFDTNRAIIQMSLRMKSNDHFWWTFFHEAAHIILTADGISWTTRTVSAMALKRKRMHGPRRY